MRWMRIATLTAVLYAQVCLYNLLLGVYHWFPGYDWLRIFLPVPEAAGAGFVLLLVAFLPGTGSRKFSAALLSLPLVFLSVFSLTEAFFRHVYQRPFRIAPNLPLASNFFNMLFNTELFDRSALLLLPAFLLLLAAGGVWYLLLRAGTALLRSSPSLKNRKAVPIAAAVFLLAAIPSLAFTPRPLLTARFAGQFEREEGLPAFDAYLSVAAGGRHVEGERDHALPGIRDADIHLFIVESYGMTVFTNRHHRNRLEDFYRQAEQRLEEEGFAVLSWAYESTAFGGTSWLADAALITGLDIDTQHKYDQAIDGNARNLLHILAEKGYRRVLSAPGTSYMDERYRRFYDFSRYILHEDFDYQGPYFAYGKMPDQYQIARVVEELQAGDHGGGEDTGQAGTGGEAGESGGDKTGETGGGERQPLFVEYMLCSSHVPWNYIPPYRPSWEFPERGKIYYRRKLNTYYENSWAAGGELFAGYAHSIRYSLETVVGYIRRQLGEGEVAILVGDHQPKFPVSEKRASFAVPVHVISADKGNVEGFRDFGYIEGLVPPAGADFPGLEEFMGHFLSVTGFAESGEDDS